MRLRNPIFITATIVLFALVGCSRGTSPDSQRPTLEVSYMVQSIGAVEGKENSYDVQRFSYTLALANNDKEEVYIKEIHVTLPPEFEQRVTTKNFIIPVNKVIQPKSYIEIENSHEFNATDLTEEDIHKLAPHISSIKVVNEKTINLEGRFK